MKPRAAILLIQNERIALIERYKSGKHYFVFPGGKIEPGETPPLAAAREAKEELGVEVIIGPMVAEVWYQGVPQYYFIARASGGQFGHGTGHEMSSLPGSQSGAHSPIWMALDQLTLQPVLPKSVAELVWNSYPANWPKTPLLVTDRLPNA